MSQGLGLERPACRDRVVCPLQDSILRTMFFPTPHMVQNSATEAQIKFRFDLESIIVEFTSLHFTSLSNCSGVPGKAILAPER